MSLSFFCMSHASWLAYDVCEIFKVSNDFLSHVSSHHKKKRLGKLSDVSMYENAEDLDP